eukprot:747520-Hanusia_phi.AAC.1
MAGKPPLFDICLVSMASEAATGQGATGQSTVSLQELKEAEARIMALSIVSTAFFLAAGLLFWLNPQNNLRPPRCTNGDDNNENENSDANMVCVVPYSSQIKTFDFAPKDYLVIASWCLALFAYTFKQKKAFSDIYLAIFFTLLAFVLIKSPKRRRGKREKATHLQTNPSSHDSDTSSRYSRSESEIQEDDDLGHGSASDLLGSKLPGKDGNSSSLLRTESSVSMNEWRNILDSFTQALDDVKESIGSKCRDVKWAYAIFCTFVTKSKQGPNSLSLWFLKAKLEAAGMGRDSSLIELLKTEDIKDEVYDPSVVFEFCQRWLIHLNAYLAGIERRSSSVANSRHTSGSRYWADKVKREIVKRALSDDTVCAKCIMSAYGSKEERELLSSYAEDKL